MQNTATATDLFITPEQVLEHWQGHRRLTRKMIAAFPEDQLFSFSVGGMRPFSELSLELIRLTFIGGYGTVTGEWKNLEDLYSGNGQPATKAGLLQFWDDATAFLNEWWPRAKPGRFQEMDAALGQYEGPVWSNTLYWLDNENHHRGQGYVYLRALGIEPPYFWDRE